MLATVLRQLAPLKQPKHQPVLYNGQAIPSVDYFQFLGLHGTNALCMTAAAKRRKPALYHAWREM
jgi:hypothetical protein